MTELPIEARAHVILTYDRNLINCLSEIPESKPDDFQFAEFRGRNIGVSTKSGKVTKATKKVFYDAVCVKMPRWRDPQEFAERVVEATNGEEVEMLEGKVINLFCDNVEATLDFEHIEAHETAEKLSAVYGIKFVVEALDKEYLPF